MRSLFQKLNAALDALWNRGLHSQSRITLQLHWPIWLFPIALVNQLLTPHPVWIVVLITVGGLYSIGFLWVRSQANAIHLTRQRTGMLLVAGDQLNERFDLTNRSPLPLLWAEFVDGSDMPGYSANRVVACGANSSYQWQFDIECRQRGVYQLGPARLTWTDPFALFRVNRVLPEVETILIYPRVAQLPELQLPHGNTSGARYRQRPLFGSVRSTSVREYRPGDSLRYIHWPSTAHKQSLMVTELDAEPGGEVWIILDLNRAVHTGEGETDTFEYSIVVAASIAAQLLSNNIRQAVGLITTSTAKDQATAWDPYAATDAYDDDDLDETEERERAPLETVLVPPQTGQAQLWRILSELAPVQPVDLSLTELLRSSRQLMGSGRILVVITPQLDVVDALNDSAVASDGAATATSGTASERAPTYRPPSAGEHTTEEYANSWVAELINVQAQAIGSVFLIVPDTPEQASDNEELQQLEEQLAHYDIPTRVFYSGQPLPSLLTHRRTRRVIRTTPTGGAVAYEVEEEIG
jgi:uncharacterized protein (DUF58 family)